MVFRGHWRKDPVVIWQLSTRPWYLFLRKHWASLRWAPSAPSVSITHCLSPHSSYLLSRWFQLWGLITLWGSVIYTHSHFCCGTGASPPPLAPDLPWEHCSPLAWLLQHLPKAIRRRRGNRAPSKPTAGLSNLSKPVSPSRKRASWHSSRQTVATKWDAQAN